jgi:hypothetical protein
MEVLSEDQITGRPSELPAPSRVVAVRVPLCPITRFNGLGVTVTVATTGRTFTVVCPTLPSAVAVMVTAPTTLPVTRPVDDTVAAASLLELHVMLRAGISAPAASRRVAVSCTV